MVSSIGFSSNPYQQQKQAVINKRYNDIYAHEQMHKQAAGSLGGSIVIEKDGNGIPTGGHVDIQMPIFNKKNTKKTIEQADIVIKSAMAPSDPSDQDYKVAAQARSVKSQAENYKGQQEAGSKLNFYA